VPPPQGAHHARCHPTDLHSMLDTLPRRRLLDRIRYGSSSDSCPRSLSAACAMPSTTPRSATSASLVRRARARNCITTRWAPAHRLVYVVLPVWVSQPRRGGRLTIVELSSTPWFINDRPSSTCSLAALLDGAQGRDHVFQATSTLNGFDIICMYVAISPGLNPSTVGEAVHDHGVIRFGSWSGSGN
jgi:hypothetical protein